MIDRVNSPLLRAAVDRVLAAVAVELGSPADGVTETLQALAAALDEYPALPVGPQLPANSVLSLRLLERIRTELVDLAGATQPRPSVDEVLPLLQAVEGLQARLKDNVPDRRPISFLGQPYTPDLVVELAHDLRSPLTSILFLADTLRQGQSGAVNSLQHRQLAIIYSAALSLVSMAGDVIEFARGGEQLSDREPTAFSTAELLGAIVDLVQPMAEGRGVDLRIRPAERDLLVGYPVPLSRVLLNLVTNALKVTEDGFVEVAVREHLENCVEFSVRDSGPGIDEETQKHLFDPFRSKGPTGIGFSGTGLGLSICRKLVAAMGGELRYETAPGSGTRFFFLLDLPNADLP